MPTTRFGAPPEKLNHLEVLERTHDDILARNAHTVMRIACGDVNRLGIDAPDEMRDLIICMAMRLRDQMRGTG